MSVEGSALQSRGDGRESTSTSTDSPLEEQFPSGEHGAVENCRGKLMPFHPLWSYGFNKSVPVINLSKSNDGVLFYASSHVGVLHDYSLKKIAVLQGHRNAVTSISADGSGRWLATADDGEDSAVIVWDAKQRLPIHTLFDPHDGRGTQLLQLSPCAKYLVTVSNTCQPTVAIWMWVTGKDTAYDACVFDTALGDIRTITFNENKTEMFILTTERRVIFATWENDKLSTHIPEAKPSRYFGLYIESVYHPYTHQALTATSLGYVIVWSTEMHTAMYNPLLDSNVKHYVKAIQLQEQPITVLTSVDTNFIRQEVLSRKQEDYLTFTQLPTLANNEITGLQTNGIAHNKNQQYAVTGDTLGHIKFYDKQLRIIFWWKDFHLDSINSISFQLKDTELDVEDRLSEVRASDTILTINDGTQSTAERPGHEDEEDRSEEYDMFCKSMLPKDLSLQKKDFIVKDFIVATETGQISRVNLRDSSCQIIVQGSGQYISAMDVHPELPHLCLGNKAGRVWMYNYNNKYLLVSQNIPNSNGGVCSLKFAPSGLYLVCGMEDGCVWFLDAAVLTPVVDVSFQNTKVAVTKICISLDSLFVAHIDESMCVSVYWCEDQVHHKWQYCGKQRSHYKPIKDLLFSEHPPPRLFSLGEDRTLVEYDILHSAPSTLKIKSVERIEQSAVPLCLTWYPLTAASETFFITANDQYKYKMLQSATKMCYKTALCPLLGSPISMLKMLPLNSADGHSKYMIFATDKHIGIQLLPVDGNPYKAVAMIAHPKKILNMVFTSDGKYVFTLGCDDFSLLMWEVDISPVEVMFKIGGEGLEPYYCLIEGGQSGWLFNEMKDLFYYSQILHFKERKKTAREVSDSIPLSVVPDLMRAIGYYPSEYEIENLVHEVKYAEYEATGTTREHVQFEDFVRLYLNHRPASGILLQEIENAFLVIAEGSDRDKATINQEKFIRILKDKGEAFSQREVIKYFSVLVSGPDGIATQSSDILDVVPKVSTEKPTTSMPYLGFKSRTPAPYARCYHLRHRLGRNDF